MRHDLPPRPSSRAAPRRISGALLLGAMCLTACPRRPTPTPSRAQATVTASDVATASDAATGRASEPEPVAPAAPGEDAPAPAVTEDQRAAALGINRLGFDLYARLRAPPRGNFALSPASIGLAFGMLEGGARGDTQAQMRRALHSSLAPSEQADALGALLARWNGPVGAGITLRTANRLYGRADQTFAQPYLDLMRTTFAAPLERLDFAQPEVARRHINAWVAEQTAGRIRELIPPGGVGAGASLALINAMYLRAGWATKFDAQRTGDRVFYANATSAVQVRMMRDLQRLPIARGRGFRMLELPYRGDQLAMDILLPDARRGLAAMEARLSADEVASLVEGLVRRQVAVDLPHFRVETASLSLRDTFVALGMHLPFDATRADFSAIIAPGSSDARIATGDVFHRVFVEVDEAGTEAAAATAVVSYLRSSGVPFREPPPVPFVVDHPFMFLIRDRLTGAVLFIGRVVDPRGGG